MRKLISHFLLMFMVMPVLAWEYEFKNKFSVIPIAGIVELPSGDILVAYWKLDLSTQNDSVYSCGILRLRSDGSFKDTTEFTHHFGAHIFLGPRRIMMAENQIIIVGSAVDTLNDIVNAFLIKTDLNLSVEFDTIYQDHNVIFDDVWKDSGSGYYVLGIIGDMNVESFRTYWLLDSSFQVKSKLLDSSHQYLPQELGWTEFDPNASALLYYSAWGLALWKFDPISLNALGYYNNDTVAFEGKPHIQNSRIALAGRMIEPMSWPPIAHLYFQILDSDFIPIDSFYYVDATSENRPATTYAICSFNSDFFMGATGNFNGGSNIFQTWYRSFMLLKFNENADLSWVRKYRNDCSYRMISVNNLNDGGIIMIGERWNWPEDSTRKEVSMYILKVDSNGTPTGNVEWPIAEVEFSIYPNPSADLLFIEIEGYAAGEMDYDYIIRNITGNLVLKGAFRESKLQLDVSGWPAGVYVISVGNKEGNGSKRFIKF